MKNAARAGLLGILSLAGCAEGPAHLELNSPNRWTLTPSLRIGGVDQPNYSFGSVDGLAVGDDDRVYVLDRINATIHLFDGQGRFVRRIGRRGSGPNELGNPTAIGRLGDTIWISDAGNRRVAFYSLSGEVIETLPIVYHPEPPFAPSVPHAMLRNGLGIVTPPEALSHAVDRAAVETAIVRVRRDGSVQDTVLLRPYAAGILFMSAGSFFAFDPFGDLPILKAAHNGSSMVIASRQVARDAETAAFRIQRFPVDASPATDQSYPYAPQAIRPGLADSLVAAAISDIPYSPEKLQTFGEEVKMLAYLPAFHPPISDIVVADDGSTWVRREEMFADTVVWNVLDAQGRMAASMTVPRGLRIHVVQDSTIWGVERDDLGVEYVVRYSASSIP